MSDSEKERSHWRISAPNAADRSTESHARILLNQKDWDTFYDALQNPPKPNEALMRAAKRYRARMSR